MSPETIGICINLAVNLGLPLGVIALAFVIGHMIERKHYESIRRREAATIDLPAITSRNWDTARRVAEVRMLTASVVVSIDYCKRLLGALRNIVGGRVRAFESVLDRGRREAILRLKEACPEADIIVNLRIETSTISKTRRNGKQAVGCIEVLAYGTAVRYAPPG